MKGETAKGETVKGEASNESPRNETSDDNLKLAFADIVDVDGAFLLWIGVILMILYPY